MLIPSSHLIWLPRYFFMCMSSIKPSVYISGVNGYKAQCACAVSRDRFVSVNNKHIIGIPDPMAFTYSLYNFLGATMMI